LSYYYYYFIIITIIIIILCSNSKHVKTLQFEFVALDITRKNYLYWILGTKIHLNPISPGNAINEINKAFVQLICFYNNKIGKREFTNILNLFHVFL